MGLNDSSRLSRFFANIGTELRFALSILSVVDQEFMYPKPLVDEHRAILEAILRSDKAEAQRLALEHLDANQARLTTIVRQRVTEDAWN